jgi:hypothetical protein
MTGMLLFIDLLYMVYPEPDRVSPKSPTRQTRRSDLRGGQTPKGKA